MKMSHLQMVVPITLWTIFTFCHLFLPVFASNHTVLYQDARLHQFVSYSDLTMFEYSVPDSTEEIFWFFRSLMADGCPERSVYIYLQHGSFPLFDGPNTYPDHFNLQRSKLINVTMTSGDNVTVLAQKYPLPGSWFGVAHVDMLENRAVHKLTDKDCDYRVQLNVTTSSSNVVPLQLIPGKQKAVLSGEKSHIYRFYPKSSAWKYTIQIDNCTIHNISTLESDNKTAISRSQNISRVNSDDQNEYEYESASCSLDLAIRAGAFPTDDVDTFHQLCDLKNGNTCVFYINQPEINKPHFLSIENKIDLEMSFQIELIEKECLIPVDLSNDWLMPPTSGNDTSDTFIPFTTDTQNNVSCMSLVTLNRMETMNTDFKVMYSMTPFKATNISVADYPRVVYFDILPIKDIGGTLMVKVMVKPDIKNVTTHANMTICIRRDSLPVADGDLYCENHERSDITTFGEGNRSVTILYPYPEPGRWVVGFQRSCYTIDNTTNTTEPVECENNTIAELRVMISECVASSCENKGACQMYYEGLFFYSSCSCVAGYRGYACTDDSEVKPSGVQLAYTLIVTLSNLGFLPPFILAIKRGFYVQSIIYFSNMFFSGFYHACDMNTWSLYQFCIMPYHVLSYCDFFLSIMSFWVTLLAMMAFSETFTSVIAMVGVVCLSMGVQWQQHGFWTMAVPILAGVLLLLLSWIIRCKKLHRCYPPIKQWLLMIPGGLLAIAGVTITLFFQTDENYPITHSIWHLVISTCILFLLPPKSYSKIKSEMEQVGESSSEGSADSQLLRLMPATQMYSHLHLESDDEPLRDLL